jgi:DNA-3-methyladenine glycosylase II
MRSLRGIADLRLGVKALVEQEPRFGVVAREGLPPLRLRRGGFSCLVEIIVEQMISLKASKAIIGRLRSAFDPLEPSLIAGAAIEQLREVGLSNAKAISIKTIADEVARGLLDFDKLKSLGDEDVRGKLMALPGVGSWSADIYLLTALGRSDIWPHGDIALKCAAKQLFALPARPTDHAMRQMAEPWRPWRAVAARLLWSYYRRLNGLEEKVFRRRATSSHHRGRRYSSVDMNGA